MAAVTRFFEVVGGTPVDILALLVALGVVGLAGYCVYVVHVSRRGR